MKSKARMKKKKKRTELSPIRSILYNASLRKRLKKVEELARLNLQLVANIPNDFRRSKQNFLLGKFKKMK